MLKTLFKSMDWRLIVPTILLLVIGYIMIFSTTSFKGLSEFDDAYFFIKRQSIFLMLGFVLFFIGALIPIDRYKKWALPGYLVSVGLLLITLIPGIGVKIGGAQRWLNVFGFQFQPVEVMKFWWAISVSLVLAKKTPKLNMFSTGMLPVFMIMLIPILCLMLQPDLGNAILTLTVGFSLLLLSKLPAVVFLLASGIGGGIVTYSVLTHPYQMDRIRSFLNPWLDPLGANYHIIQSFTAIGSGGVFGFGIGESRLKYFYLPLHYSDFIFSILCEEGGLFLAVIVVCGFGAIFIRGIQIAFQKKQYSFEQFVALSLTFYLIFQAIINICVVSGLFPITGIPLTFISYGGTSLLSSLYCLGVMHRIGATK
jgi:cell division protein FtsW